MNDKALVLLSLLPLPSFAQLFITNSFPSAQLPFTLIHSHSSVPYSTILVLLPSSHNNFHNNKLIAKHKFSETSDIAKTTKATRVTLTSSIDAHTAETRGEGTRLVHTRSANSLTHLDNNENQHFLLDCTLSTIFPRAGSSITPLSLLYHQPVCICTLYSSTTHLGRSHYFIQGHTAILIQPTSPSLASRILNTR